MANNFGKRRVYQDSDFHQKIYFHNRSYEILSVAEQVITTKIPHCIAQDDPIVLAFSGSKGDIFETLATVTGENTFTVPDDIPQCFVSGVVLCPQKIDGILEARIYSYPSNKIAVPGKITVENGSNVALIIGSEKFDYQSGLTLTAGDSFVDASVEDISSSIDSPCGTIYRHKILLSNPSTGLLSNSDNFFFSGEDIDDKKQSILAHTHTTFLGDQNYGAVEFHLDKTIINALSTNNHKLSIFLDDALIAYGQITFCESSDTNNSSELVEFNKETFAIEFLGGNTLSNSASNSVSFIRNDAAFTIPTSGGVTVSIDPADALGDGQEELAIVEKIPGTLSRSGAVYTFTRTQSGASTPVAANSLITITADPLNDIVLTDKTLSTEALELDTPPLNFQFGSTTRFPFLLVDQIKQLLLAVQRDGSTRLNEIVGQFGEIRTQTSRYVFSVTGKDGIVFLALDRLSKAVLQAKELKIKADPIDIDGVKIRSSSRFPFVVEDKAGSAVLYIDRQGVPRGHTGTSLISAANQSSVASDGSERYFSNQQSDGSLQIEKISSGELITSEGNNYNLSSGTGEITFISDRDGTEKPYSYDGTHETDLRYRERVLGASHLLFTANGQSLSTGSGGFPGSEAMTALTHSSTFKLDDAGTTPLFDGSGDVLSLVAYTDPVRTVSSDPSPAYPDNIKGSIPPSAMARQLEEMGYTIPKIVDSVGSGSKAYAWIKKNGSGNAFASATYIAESVDDLVSDLFIPCEYLIHGENDSHREAYKDEILEYSNDIQDRKAATGQTEDIKLLITQQSGAPVGNGNIPVSPEGQRQAALESSNVTLIEPTYQYDTELPDVIHPHEGGRLRRGIKFAQVTEIVAINNGSWRPLEPVAASASGQIITITYHVPYPPMQFDPNITQEANLWINGANIANPWLLGKGFEVFDSADNPLTIDSCVIDGKDIVITVNSGTPDRILYGMHQNWDGTNQVQQGPRTGRRGSLMDSDPLEGFDKETISCALTNGSATVTSSALFGSRSDRDNVSGSDLGDTAIVVTKTDNSTMTLSENWAGSTGTHDLTFVYPQNNYGVLFDINLPYTE